MSALDLLLRRPDEAARTATASDGDLRALVATSIGAVAAGGAAFGGVVGSFRGGEQIAYAAIKLPLALLAALAIGVPAFHAIGASLGRRWTFRAVIALSLASAGRGALVLFATAPLLWLAIDRGLGYHATALAATLAFALSGIAALGVLLRGLGTGPTQLASAIAIAAVFLVVSAQTSWILRPWLVRPRTEDVPFVRAREGGFADAIATSARSAVGIYDGVREVSWQSADDLEESVEDAWAREPLGPGGFEIRFDGRERAPGPPDDAREPRSLEEEWR